MTEYQKRIWERMSAADRERVDAAGTMYREQLIELWEAAQRNERRFGRYDPPKNDDEARQDELDELLMTRASHGDYGPVARQVVSESCSHVQPGTSRRALLRAVRKAIEATRN